MKTRAALPPFAVGLVRLRRPFIPELDQPMSHPPPHPSLKSISRAPTGISGAVGFILLLLLLGPATSQAAAQTDFYNLDKDRPLRVEDAYATKRWAFELKAAPLTLSQDEDGVLRYAPSLELKHGLLPGVEVSVGQHLDVSRVDSETSTGLGSLELSALANLWVESRTLPAVGVRVTGHVATESEADSWMEIRGLATRGLGGPVRAHLAGGWMSGDGRAEDWWVGLALDYVLPFHHTLLLAETWIAEPRTGSDDELDRTVHSTMGARYQLSPTLAMDAGVGRSWAGQSRQDWFLTLGVTYEFAVRALMPRRNR